MARKLTLETFLPYRLSVASNAVSARISVAYRRRFGLKVAEWRLIAVLAEQERMTPAMLASTTRMDKIAVSRAAAVLGERGLVATVKNPEDGRSHFLSLTADGRALYREIAPLALGTEAALFAGFSADERATLERLLRRIERDAEILSIV